MSGDDPRLQLVYQHIDSERVNAAIDLLTELLAEQSSDARYHGLLAMCLLKQKRIVAAEYEIGVALSQDPSLPFLHEVRARLLFLKNKIDDAIVACDESLQLDPVSVDCHLLKSAILGVRGKNDEALVVLQRAAQLDPGNIQVAIAFGDHCNSAGRRNEALAYAKEALRIDAGNHDANILMGETQLLVGNLADSEYHAKFAISQNPNSKDALRLFANIKMRRNWFTGLWWRFNSWLATLGNLHAALVLIGGFLFFNIVSEIADDLGYSQSATVLSSAWLVLVLYSWIGIPMYHKAMAKELKKFRFDRDF